MKISKQKGSHRLLSALQCCALALAFHPLSVAALEDELQMPAMKTELFNKKLLTDVTRAGDRLVAVGSRGHIVLSDDGGEEWVQAEVPVRVNLTAATFIDDQTGWVSGHCGVVLHTSDGGETWTKQLDGSHASRIILASAEREVVALEEAVSAAGDGADEDLLWDLETATWRLEDAQRDVEVGPAKPIMDIWFKNERVGFAVGAYGYFLRTNDGGQTWEDQAPRIDNPDSLHLYAVNGVHEGVLFIVGEEGSVHRSMDGGDSWQSLDSPYMGGLFDVVGSGLEGHVHIVGLNGNVFHTTDFGDSWQRVDARTRSSLFGGLTLPDNRQVFVGQDGVLLVCGGGRESCAVVPREDRQTLSAVVLAGDSRVLVVGMGGLELLTLPSSLNENITKASD
jgi:photosystem II stability/assembly factor-like uncharacterized protein